MPEHILSSPQLSTDDCLWTETEAARYLHLSVQTMRNRRAQRRPPSFLKLENRTIRYRKSDLDACLVEYKAIFKENTLE